MTCSENIISPRKFSCTTSV